MIRDIIIAVGLAVASLAAVRWVNDVRQFLHDVREQELNS